MNDNNTKSHLDGIKHPVTHSLIAVFALLLMVLYGLAVRPIFLSEEAMPLEIVFLMAAIIAITHLLFIGIDWQIIEQSIGDKLTKAIPTILLLFAIGILIGSWMISGTIPMLIHIALNSVSAQHIYLLSFIVPIIFSLCTGTSWGSIATVGLVLITVASVVNADLAIAAGAIVAGAYFGDKLSPLSDTTNIAALAVNISVYQHIQAMLYTTLPSAIIAGIGFSILDSVKPSLATQSLLENQESLLAATLLGIESLFHFSWWLLLPPMIVLIGAIKKIPPLPVLILSSCIASALAVLYQGVEINHIIQTWYQGFNIEMLQNLNINSSAALPKELGEIFNRGGIYALNAPIMITILVFIYVGAISCIDAVPTLIKSILKRIKSRAGLISASLVASAATNAMTSSQYANSFIVGEAFARQYDNAKIPRKVLSRSLEDTGTMIESIVPWSTTSVFIFASLGVSVVDYWQWQLLSLVNIPLAFVFALTGIACFYPKHQQEVRYGK